MQNKKRLQKHLLFIYIIYFAALGVGFAAEFIPDFTNGWDSAQQTLNEDMEGRQRTYYVSATLRNTQPDLIVIPGLPENITTQIERVNLHVSLDEPHTLSNAFKISANNGYTYLLALITLFSYLAIFIIIVLIIKSLRKSIQEEQPLPHRNILFTRFVGALILVAELSEAAMKYINQMEATRLLADTAYEVAQSFPMNYWNIIVGILFLFMAEVFSIGTQLSEEQKLTI